MSAMWIVVLLLIAASGFYMARWVGEHRTGIRAAAGYFLLLFVPYLSIFVFLALIVDPTWEPARRTYNLMLAFDFVALAFSLPWLVSLLAGGVVGVRRRRSSSRPGS